MLLLEICFKSYFFTKVRVEGYNYVGMGNSTNKKDAQSNSARDFVNYLVRMKEISPGEVPALGVSITSRPMLTTAHLLCVMKFMFIIFRPVYLMEGMVGMKKVLSLEVSHPTVHYLHIWL